MQEVQCCLFPILPVAMKTFSEKFGHSTGGYFGGGKGTEKGKQNDCVFRAISLQGTLKAFGMFCFRNRLSREDMAGVYKIMHGGAGEEWRYRLQITY